MDAHINSMNKIIGLLIFAHNKNKKEAVDFLEEMIHTSKLL